MRSETALLAEYAALREEILQADAENCRLLGVSVAGVLAALWTAMGHPSPVVGLAIVLITAFGVWIAWRFLQGNRRRIWRIASYVRIFVEPLVPDLKWETRIDAQRRMVAPDSRQRLSAGAPANEGFVILALEALCGLSAAYDLHGLTTVTWVRLAAWATLLILFWVLLRRIWGQIADIQRLGGVDDLYIAKWLAVKAQEQTRASP